jgi:hypothetical protein
MHGTLPATGIRATSAADTSVSDQSSNDTSVIVPLSQWFSRICGALFPHKPGLALHLETDCGERNGHRYASGEVAVPSLILRILLRGRGGRTWLGAIMEGSDAEWWRDLQRAERIAAQVDRLDLGR